MALFFRDTSGRERYGFVINATCILILSCIATTSTPATLAHAQPQTITGKVVGLFLGRMGI